MDENVFDVVVVGAGPGGYPSAIRAAQLGARVVLIEKQWVGGTCLHCGCIPTKTLIAGAALYQQMKKASELGIRVDDLSVDYQAMMARKDGVVDGLQGGIRQLLKANNVELVEGEARFVSATELLVGDRMIVGKKIIVATGARSVMPSFIPQHSSIMDSRAFLEQGQLPRTLLVLGGGYIGCEFACLAAALGVEVTLVEMLDDVLLLLDRDVRSEIKRQMKAELGITILAKTRLESIQITADALVEARAGETLLAADQLLVAVGRQPNTEGLGLGVAGIDVDERGAIPVDEFGRSSLEHVYAVGDVNGGIQLAHAATHQGLRAADHACGQEVEKTEALVPGVLFTLPEAAFVGVTQSDVKAGLDVKKAKFFYRALGKASACGEQSGFVKWFAEVSSGRLVGAQVVGAYATELIAEATLAIQAGLTAEDVANTIHAHPTFSEAWVEAAHKWVGKPVHSL